MSKFTTDTSKSIPKILLIYESFPPEKSSGIGRPVSIFSGLQALSMDVTILTKNSYGRTEDEAKVLRAPSLDLWKSSPNLYIYKILSWILFRLGFCSNDLLFYIKGKKLLDRTVKNGIDLIYASFPYTNSLLLALYAKKRYGIRFIAEFRDGYIFEPLFPKNPIQKWTAKNLEALIARECVAIVTIGKNLSAYFQEKYSNTLIYTVYNGYSRGDFGPRLLEEPETGKCTIGYFGSFLLLRNKGRSIKPLVDGLRSAMDEAKIIPGSFLLLLIGNYLETEKAMFNKAGLDPFVEYLPYMDKRAGFSFLAKKANYLLFIGVEGETTIVSAKLPEYLFLGKPILGICEGNEAANIISDTGTGEVCGFSADDIKQLFLKAIRKNLKYNPSELVIHTFDRESQAKRVGDIIMYALEGKENT